MKLPFQKEKELRLAIYRILGYYPHNIQLYQQALLHKSVNHRNESGRPVNNERLEFLGDAILDAVAADIVYQHFPRKREGFLTNTRSKLVQRETLNRLAEEMGIVRLITSSSSHSSHNSYVAGNAFEALVGALFLDRGYHACETFFQKKILDKSINLDRLAKQEVNFKSRLIEYCQKRKIDFSFEMIENETDDDGNPIFTFQVFINNQPAGVGTGYSKKESQQHAAQETLEMIRQHEIDLTPPQNTEPTSDDNPVTA